MEFVSRRYEKSGEQGERGGVLEESYARSCDLRAKGSIPGEEEGDADSAVADQVAEFADFMVEHVPGFVGQWAEEVGPYGAEPMSGVVSAHHAGGFSGNDSERECAR